MALFKKLGMASPLWSRYAGVLKNTQCATFSSSALYEKDPQPHFTDPETQKLLQSMTRFSLKKLFGKRTVPDNTNSVQFMTTDQLDAEFVAAIRRGEQQLLMPPQVKIMEDIQSLISYDPALKDFDTANYVFADISYGLKQSERKVVIRYPDGVLKHAPLETAKRVRQTFVPLAERKHPTPRLFTMPKYFQRCLDAHEYEFLLNRTLWQYEPYEEEFHKHCAKIYDHINDEKKFDVLRSTRHFGPMAFYFACKKCIDNLLCDMIQRDYLSNAAELIALFYKVHNIEKPYKDEIIKLQKLLPTPAERALQQLRMGLTKNKTDVQRDIQNAIGKTEEDFESDEISLNLIETYIASEHALKKSELEFTLQTIVEVNEEKRQLFDGLRKAHGVQQIALEA